MRGRFSISEFIALIQDINMWGGSGAVWEVAQLGTDTSEFRKAIIKLAAAMDRDGIATDRSRDIASVFDNWNRRGL